MGFFDDWGDALAGPFISFGNTFETLFTNPSKLKAKDIPTLVLPIPGVGSAITYDLEHPSAAGYQAATLAAVGGGAYAYDPYSVTFTEAQKAAAAENALWESPLADDVAKEAALDAYWNSPLQDTAAQAEIDLDAQWNAPIDLEKSFGAGGGGIVDSIKSAAAGTGSFVKEAALVSAAAKSILAPWGKAIDNAKQLLGLGGGIPGSAGRPNVVAGGGQIPGGSSAPAQQASAANLLTVGLVVSVGGLLAWKLYKGRK